MGHSLVFVDGVAYVPEGKSGLAIVALLTTPWCATPEFVKVKGTCSSRALIERSNRYMRRQGGSDVWLSQITRHLPNDRIFARVMKDARARGTPVILKQEFFHSIHFQ